MEEMSEKPNKIFQFVEINEKG